MLIRSTAAKLLAIRQVTQLNTGKKTAGVDGKKSLNHVERMKLLTLLNNAHDWVHKELRTIPIPKKNGKTRMLKVSTIADRAWQCLVKYALEPAHEAVFHPYSYGFRVGRSAHDAQKIIFQQLNSYHRGWEKSVIELDIRKCFDTIAHSAIMKRLIAPQYLKNVYFGALSREVTRNFRNKEHPKAAL